MFTLFHSLKNRKLPTSTTRFYFTDLYLNPSPFPLLKFTILETKKTRRWNDTGQIQFSSVVSFLLMCLLPPPSNVNPFHLPPKKKIVKGRDYWGSEPDGQLERE